MYFSLINMATKTNPVASSTIRKLIPNDGGLDLQHLRRFAKVENLPDHLRESLTYDEDAEERAGLFVIIGSTNILPQQAVIDGLAGMITDPNITAVPVPLLAPTTAEQATLWTGKYWPTVYKKSNPFGPHLSLVSRAAEEINGDAGKWMALAAAVAAEAESKGYGEGFGVVVVERRDGLARPVAVAGDARWKDWHHERIGGNVTAHAAMRGIGMVAEGLRRREVSNGLAIPSFAGIERAEIFQDVPVLELEERYYDTSDNGNGYLCFDLEIYCTHEPCVMCAMAIVHSRFGRLVFGKRMKQTGGICAEADGLGCGLWWRKELNWTMLAWQHVQGHEDENDDGGIDSMLHV
jgi:tRNA-specific adenosine deaminase 3